jgi:hypothetical protein
MPIYGRCIAKVYLEAAVQLRILTSVEIMHTGVLMDHYYDKEKSFKKEFQSYLMSGLTWLLFVLLVCGEQLEKLYTENINFISIYYGHFCSVYSSCVYEESKRIYSSKKDREKYKGNMAQYCVFSK